MDAFIGSIVKKISETNPQFSDLELNGIWPTLYF